MFKSLFSRFLKPPADGDGTTFLSYRHSVSLSSGELEELKNFAQFTFFPHLIYYIKNEDVLVTNSNVAVH